MGVGGSSSLEKYTSRKKMFYVLGTMGCMDSVELLAHIMTGGRVLCGVTGSRKGSVQLAVQWLLEQSWNVSQPACSLCLTVLFKAAESLGKCSFLCSCEVGSHLPASRLDVF